MVYHLCWFKISISESDYMIFKFQIPFTNSIRYCGWLKFIVRNFRSPNNIPLRNSSGATNTNEYTFFSLIVGLCFHLHETTKYNISQALCCCLMHVMSNKRMNVENEAVGGCTTPCIKDHLHFNRMKTRRKLNLNCQHSYE